MTSNDSTTMLCSTLEKASIQMNFTTGSASPVVALQPLKLVVPCNTWSGLPVARSLDKVKSNLTLTDSTAKFL